MGNNSIESHNISEEDPQGENANKSLIFPDSTINNNNINSTEPDNILESNKITNLVVGGNEKNNFKENEKEGNANSNINIKEENIEESEKEDNKFNINEDDINISNKKEIEEKLHKTKNSDKNKKPRRQLERNNTYSQPFLEKNNIIEITPNNCMIFEKMNLFNSILIMMNNISYINEYFSKIESKQIIDKCEKNNKNYCLSSILFYLNKCMWNKNTEKQINEQKLFEKYNNYIDRFCTFKKAEPNLYLYDNQNVEKLIEEIYDKINKELSSENKIKYEYKTKENRGGTVLSKYINEFLNTNKSKISDNFIGHFVTQKYNHNCDDTYKINLTKNKEFYKSFYKLIFNINEIEQYFQNQRNLLILKNNSNIKFANTFNLIDCFDYSFDYNNKTYSSCEKCKNKYCIKQLKILILPKILTIVFNNNKNNKLILKDKIKLNKYIYKNNYNMEYYLTSILCYYFTKYICYCINPTNGFWYRYSDGKIEKVEKMDINSIPLIAIYQVKDQQNFKYNKIIIEDKDNIIVEFANLEVNNFNLWFNKNTTIETIIQDISKLINKEKTNIYLINDANIVDKSLLLKDLIKNNEESIKFLILTK